MRNIQCVSVFAIAGMLALALVTPAPIAAQDRTLDEKLLDDLGGDPLDDFDPLDELDPLAPDGDDKPKPEQEGELPPDLLKRLEQKLGNAAIDENEDPMLTIARRMRQAERRIRQNDSTEVTQNIQKQILDDLDKLIDEQKKNRKKSGGGGGGQQNAPRPRQTPNQQPQTKPGDKPSNKPATTSSERPQGNGEAEKVNMDRMRVVIKKLWGELPQHQREQMLQLPIEEFLPKYQTMIEEYFRRLAEEKE